MALRRTSITNVKAPRAFTLIEILIVVGLIALLGGVGMIMSMQVFRTEIFKNDADLLVGVLRQARSQSVNNMCFGVSGACTDGKMHGVHVVAGAYTIFQTDSDYAGRDVSIDQVTKGKPGVTVSGSISDVIFKKLSGETTAGTIVLTDEGGKSTTITLNTEGRIISN